MKRKPRIAVIGLKGLPAYGGAAAVGENIINRLHDTYDFTVYSISTHTILKSGVYEGSCKQIVLKAIPFKRLNSLLYYLRSAIHSLFTSYDLIHLHHRDASFIIPLLRLKYKVVLTTHGMVLTDKWSKYKSLFDFQDRIFLRFASIITTVSLKDLGIVRKILKSSKKRIVHIPNGVNECLNSFEKKNHLVFSAGRIIPNKGVHLLLEAAIKNKIRDKILVIGDLSQMSEYGKHISFLASQLPNVELVDLIKNKDDLFSIIGTAKLFIYPSLIESMSMMMLEVASLGTPMICSRIKENTDIFNEDEVLYFEPGNADDLAKKMDWAFNNMHQMNQKAVNARLKLLQSYLWKDISDKYAEVFKTLLSD